MEERGTIMIGKRIWNVVRAILFMVRKGISKGRIMVELNLMLKRGKNLVFHRPTVVSAVPRHYEFSCTTTPSHSHSFPFLFPFPSKKTHKHPHPLPTRTFDDLIMTAGDLFEDGDSTAPSPYLPGFGRTPTPLVRPLRITDSPFPLSDDDHHPDHSGFVVDQAAEEFIQRFYMDLKNQTTSSFFLHS